MRTDLLLAVPLALALVGACSSSSSGTGGPDGGNGSGSGGGSGSGSGGGSGSGSGGSGSGGGSGGGTSDGGGRPVESCSQIQSAAMSTGVAFTLGSWGPIPAGLQALPSGATLCGLQSDGDAAVEGNDIVIVDSALTGQALLAFYAPLAEKLSCTQVTVPSSPGFFFTCPNNQTFEVTPNSAAAYLMLTLTSSD
jgi:hypothetical protein